MKPTGRATGLAACLEAVGTYFGYSGVGSVLGWLGSYAFARNKEDGQTTKVVVESQTPESLSIKLKREANPRTE